MQWGCNRCAAPAVLAMGLREIVSKNPRGVLPGVIALLGIGMLVVCWDWVFTRLVAPCLPLSGTVGHVFRTGVDIVGLLGAVWMALHLPVRALICTRCGRITKLGMGRRIPIAWQEGMEPATCCTFCGYSLRGTQSARCPECGTPFPESWLEKPNMAEDSQSAGAHSG